METLGDEKVAKSSKKVANEFYCNFCDYICSKKFNWDKHLLTSKHCKVTSGDKFVAKVAKSSKNIESQFICEYCDKEYFSRNGLWKHKQKCNLQKNTTTQNEEYKSAKKDEIISLLLKQNSELIKEQSDIKQLILEICKNGVTNDSYNTTHTNSHNKAFNLHFYLNETCKNAMNLSEFIDSINPQLSDLEKVGELGYVEGISKIIVDNLNKLDATKRPVNCTDKKRDSMYIKDDNKWEKDEENIKLNGAVKKVAFKNTKLFPQFKEKYPDYIDSESIHSDRYSKIVIESLNDNRENNQKVIKNIAHVTTIKEK